MAVKCYTWKSHSSISKEPRVSPTRTTDAISSTSTSSVSDHSDVLSTSNRYLSDHSDVLSNSTSNLVQDAQDAEALREVMSSHNKTNTMADYDEIVGNTAVIDCPHAEIIDGPDSHDE